MPSSSAIAPVPGLLARALVTGALIAPMIHAQTTLKTFAGTQGGESHGYSVANAGDVDGDGRDDIIVGSPYYDLFQFPNLYPDAGKIVVRSGATGAILMSKVGGNTQEYFGFDVDGAGDVNNDGFADVIVGEPGKQVGGFVVFFGPDGSTSQEKLSPLTGQSGFGQAVAGCGDANGDGYDDVVIGWPLEHQVAAAEVGSVRVYDVFHDAYIGTVFGKQAYGHLGWSVDGAGDVDGDGWADVVAGEPGRDVFVPPLQVLSDVGRAYVFTTGQIVLGEMAVVQTLVGDLIGGSEFGYAVSGGGLIDNGDSVPDLIVGAPGANSGAGKVSIRSGSSGGLLNTYNGSQTGERFGAAVAGGGDFDGNGLTDVIIGAPFYDLGTFGNNEGRIEVRSALSGAILHTATSLGGGQIGFSVDIGARLDFDSRDEIIYGAPMDDGAASNAGASRVVSSSDFLTAVGFYGVGLAGSLGEPGLSAMGSPSIGSSMSILLESSAPATGLAVLAAGFAPLSLPFEGGTLLVDPLRFLFLNLPPGSTALPVFLEDDTQLLGLNIYLQLWQQDAGAVFGVALSHGMHLVLGN